MNIGRYITRIASYYPDHTAVIDGDRRIAYRELEGRTNRLAHGLMSLGLGKGARLAIQAWNRLEIVEFEVACHKTGMIRVPLNARLALAETIHVLNDAEVKAIVADADHLEPLLANRKELKTVEHFIGLEAPASPCPYDRLLSLGVEQPPEVEVEADDLAVLAYTSGTTGRLKGIIQTFGNRMAMIRKACMIPGIKLEPGDLFAHVGPLTHSSGMLLMPVMYFGGCNLVLPRFDVLTLLETIQREKVNYLLLVPAMINMILAHPRAGDFDLGSLKGVFYGAAPMSVSGIKQAMERFGPILIQGYGMSETTSFVSILTAGDHLRALEQGLESRLASCGRPVFESEVKVVDEEGRQVSPGSIGEIVIRGPDVMRGYFNEPELTQKALKGGWIFSNDLAKVDQEGYLYIVDRKTDMIISGGFNIYPSEVEQVLQTHPAVFEACVIGVPDEKWGEAVKGIVVLQPGFEVEEEDLIEHCKRFLGSYKKPQSIEFVEALPRNPNGKLAKRVLKEKYWADIERGVH